MIKHTRFFRLCTDEDMVISTKAPEPIDEWDGTCPACGSASYQELLTVVQHGWLTDDCLMVCRCGACHEAFHYYFTVDAAALDEVVRRAFEPPSGG